MNRLLGYVADNPINNLNVAAYDMGEQGVMLVAEHVGSCYCHGRLRIDHQEWEGLPKGTGQALLGQLERMGITL